MRPAGGGVDPTSPAPAALRAEATPRLAGALERLRAVVVAGSGRRRAGVALGLGVLAVAALPPIHAWPALVPAFVGLYWLTGAASGVRAAFAVGWAFGFGHFAAGLYWVANALIVRGGLFEWLAPLAVVGLAALLAAFPALATAAARAMRARGVGGALVFAALWTGAEWLRGWALTGFPWNLVGTVWTHSEAMIQAAAVVGTLGLGLATVAWAAMPAALAGAASRRAAWAGIALTSLALAGAWAGGAARLAGAEADAVVADVRLRLVQPAIAQAEKWRPDLRERHMTAQIDLGRLAVGPPPTHVVWSESAAPLFLAGEPGWLAAIGAATPAGGLSIVGAPRRTPAGEPYRIWNSLHAIDPAGRILATYDKSHLVPFGEYVPLRSLLPVPKVTAGRTDFAPGAGVTTLDLAGLPPVSPLICYEVIFPGRVVDADARPAWILNLTNDGWYGRSSGPYQHLAAARLRAVEEGLPLVRVANTGISAIVDAHGRVVASLGLGKRGVVDGPLPAALAAPTPYARWGDWIAGALALAVAAVGLAVRV